MTDSKPFSRMFGKVPFQEIDRFNEKNLIIDSFDVEYPSENIYLITGVRGSGKTALLTSIANELSKKERWLTIDLNSEIDLLESLAAKIYEKGKLQKLFIKKEFSFSFKGLSFSIEGGNDIILTSETLIEKMLEYLKNKGFKVLVTIDDVECNKYMKIFSKTFQSLVRSDYPIFLLMSGLYENIFQLQNEKSLTFLYRAPKIYLQALNIKSIANSYKEIFKIDDAVAIKLAKFTNGYAYAFQVLGLIIYDSNQKDLTSKVIDQFDEILFEYSYEKIWIELSSMEQEFLLCFDSNDPIDIKTITSKLQKNNQYINTYRDKLIKKGIIISPTYGKVQFVLPRFNEFLIFKRNF